MTKCNVDHARAKRDSTVWATLELIGHQRVAAGPNAAEEPAFDLELRNCACGSTLCRMVKP